jgi:hypothetical protein
MQILLKPRAMTDSRSTSIAAPAPALPAAGIQSLLDWPDAPPPRAADELAYLQRQLASLRASQATPEQRATTLDRLYARSMSALDSLSISLTDTELPIPIPRITRQLIRNLQLLLRTLAEDLLASLGASLGVNLGVNLGANLGANLSANLSELPPPLPPEQRQRAALTLWRSLNALAQHLLLSSLIASPAGVGIWQQLHQTYETAHRLALTGTSPEGATGSLQDIYYSAVLLACAQPASFTSREVSFIAAYLARFCDAIDPTADCAPPNPAAFWIDPTQDATAFACSRKTAPPQTPAHYFSCARLAARLTEQLAELEAGATAQHTGLPDFAGTAAGHGVLRRLISYWGVPGKRRYPRRRQNYRAVLCSGLASLWRLFQRGDAEPLEPANLETSNWMITNESPDGYAFMHVSGRTSGLAVGDITAIRTESGKAWQICIVRWALSENQEHIELGLQILATRAIAARLALPARDSNHSLLAVLILPAIRALRSSEMLVVPATALEALKNPLGKLILVVEKENIKIREVKGTRLDEQNSKIAILSIEPDPRPG